ncbi:hypothetical protein ACFL35_06535 [Candidatus Riflebacteria bacterium]
MKAAVIWDFISFNNFLYHTPIRICLESSGRGFIYFLIFFPLEEAVVPCFSLDDLKKALKKISPQSSQAFQSYRIPIAGIHNKVFYRENGMIRMGKSRKPAIPCFSPQLADLPINNPPLNFNPNINDAGKVFFWFACVGLSRAENSYLSFAFNHLGAPENFLLKDDNFNIIYNGKSFFPILKYCYRFNKGGKIETDYNRSFRLFVPCIEIDWLQASGKSFLGQYKIPALKKLTAQKIEESRKKKKAAKIIDFPGKNKKREDTI